MLFGFYFILISTNLDNCSNVIDHSFPFFNSFGEAVLVLFRYHNQIAGKSVVTNGSKDQIDATGREIITA